MKQIIIKAKNGNINIIKNLKVIGIEQRDKVPGYVLFYSDENNTKRKIYQSNDREYLRKIQCKICDAYREGIEEISI